MVGTNVVWIMAFVWLFCSIWLSIVPSKSQRLAIAIRPMKEVEPIVFPSISITGVVKRVGIWLALMLTMALLSTSMAVSLEGMEECPPGISTAISMLT